jgi:hypothetical protein
VTDDRFLIYFETMAGTHLTDAVRALRDAGSSDTLYEPKLRARGLSEVDEAEYQITRDEAEYNCVSYSRRSLLFAAFAAEAYANDFLYERWSGQDREALQKLSTVDKYVLLSQLADRGVELGRGTDLVREIKWLFKRRDELVHAAPSGDDLTYKPENHNPRMAANCIVAVSEAASKLFGEAPDGSVLSRVLSRQQRIQMYGAQAADNLPKFYDPPSDQDLLRDAKPNSGDGQQSPC